MQELRIVRGEPTAEEIAAVVAVLVMRTGPVVDVAPAPVASRWRASALPSVPLRVGRGAWRASALPS